MQLYIPKEGVYIAFSPSGVKTPQRASQGQGGRPAAAAELFSEEAYAFTRQHCLQREVIALESVLAGYHNLYWLPLRLLLPAIR